MAHCKLLLAVLLLTSFKLTAGVSPWSDFSLASGHIKIPVQVAGIETSAIIDSGSQLHGINSAFIGKHELDLVRTGKLTVSGAFGDEKRNRYSRIPATIFGAEYKLDYVAELRLGHHSNGLLLGAPLFNSAVVQIDYPGKRMRLLTRDVVNLADVENTGMVQQESTGRPLVKVEIDGKTMWFLLDTGNSGGLLMERSDAKRLGLLDKDVESGMVQGVNTASLTESTRVDKVTLGPYTLDNVLITFLAEGSNGNLSSQTESLGSHIKGKRVVGLLGYDLLKHFVLTLDYRRDQLHIGLPADE